MIMKTKNLQTAPLNLLNQNTIISDTHTHTIAKSLAMANMMLGGRCGPGDGYPVPYVFYSSNAGSEHSRRSMQHLGSEHSRRSIQHLGSEHSRRSSQPSGSEHSRSSHLRHDNGESCCLPTLATSDETLSLTSADSTKYSFRSSRGSVLSRYGKPEDYVQKKTCKGSIHTPKKPFHRTSPPASPSGQASSNKIKVPLVVDPLRNSEKEDDASIDSEEKPFCRTSSPASPSRLHAPRNIKVPLVVDTVMTNSKKGDDISIKSKTKPFHRTSPPPSPSRLSAPRNMKVPLVVDTSMTNSKKGDDASINSHKKPFHRTSPPPSPSRLPAPRNSKVPLVVNTFKRIYGMKGGDASHPSPKHPPNSKGSPERSTLSTDSPQSITIFTDSPQSITISGAGSKTGTTKDASTASLSSSADSPQPISTSKGDSEKSTKEASNSSLSSSADSPQSMNSTGSVARKNGKEAYSFYGKLGSFMGKPSPHRRTFKTLENNWKQHKHDVSNRHEKSMVKKKSGNMTMEVKHRNVTLDRETEKTTPFMPVLDTNLSANQHIALKPKQTIPSKKEREMERSTLEPSREPVHNMIDEIINMELRRLELANAAIQESKDEERVQTNFEKSADKNRIRETWGNKEEEFDPKSCLDKAYAQLSHVLDEHYSQFEMNLQSAEKIKVEKGIFERKRKAFEQAMSQERNDGGGVDTDFVHAGFAIVLDDLYSEFESVVDQLYTQYEKELQRRGQRKKQYGRNDKGRDHNLDTNKNEKGSVQGTTTPRQSRLCSNIRPDIQRHKNLMDFWQEKAKPSHVIDWRDKEI